MGFPELPLKQVHLFLTGTSKTSLKKLILFLSTYSLNTIFSFFVTFPHLAFPHLALLKLHPLFLCYISPSGFAQVPPTVSLTQLPCAPTPPNHRLEVQRPEMFSSLGFLCCESLCMGSITPFLLQTPLPARSAATVPPP